MKVLRIRIAISKLIRGFDLQDSTALMVNAFHLLQEEIDPPAPLIIAHYDDIGAINVEPRKLIAEHVSVIMGYRIWRSRDIIFFEKIHYLEWEERIVYFVEYDQKTLVPRMFTVHIVSKVISLPTRVLRDKKFGRAVDWKL